MQNYPFDKLRTSNSKLKIHKNINKISYATVLIGLGILFRTAWHVAPNVEYVTTATLLAASYLGKRWAILVPLLIMIITDLMLGNTNIFLFTWSAYIFIGCLGNLSHLSDLKTGSKILRVTGLGIAGSIWFYLWTNFGVWLLDSWGMYRGTLSGLTQAYILAIPFFRYNLIGNLIFLPSSFIIVEIIKNINFNKFLQKIKHLPYESIR